jgi:hypothetical protein
MKKILFIVLLTFAMQANAQYYYPLPDTNAGWTLQVFLPGMFFYDNYYTDIYNKDTTVSLVKYTKLYYDSHLYAGSYRSDTLGHTYFIPKDSLQEFLIMDISKNVGDTVKKVLITRYDLNRDTLINLHVDSVNNLHIGPYTLKRLWLSNSSYKGCLFTLFWIEKIGTSSGFYNESSCNIEEGLLLNCMAYNDSLYYYTPNQGAGAPLYEYGLCFPTEGINNRVSLSDITISPNPASSEITVSGRQEAVGSIDVYNTLGDKVYTAPITDNRSPITINITSLPSGMYFAEIKSEKGILVKKFIKE